MTSRQLYEHALIEVNKLEAPSLLLEDYNYFINKAVQQYMNLVYSRFDVNQQTTDDLRALSTTKNYVNNDIIDNIVTLPENYVHMLNCIVTVKKKYNDNYDRCEKMGNVSREYQSAAKRLTSDMYAGILNNCYLKPSVKRPYYFVKNGDGTTLENSYAGSDKANPSDVKLEIRCGDGIVTKISVDYIKSPKHIELTYEDIYSDVDNSDVLEFSDYVCFEILNIFTRLIMENASDPRLQTNMTLNQTIGSGVSG